jgi:glycosyltransferase A (GT-A) superfamily protein (DUF2064 family)
MSMNGSPQRAAQQARSCLVLMFKSPERSKRRIAGEIGRRAADVAERLCACALEDMARWPGPVCYAPADPADADWLRAADFAAGTLLPQGRGNLGERIGRVSRQLNESGRQRQIFIGIDCPELTSAYLARAEAALDAADVVLGPAADGGVVLMATRRPWPDLRSLPWSEPTLGEALRAACVDAGRRVAQLDPLRDVDSMDDLARVRAALADDRRPARRALVRSIDRAAARRADETS